MPKAINDAPIPEEALRALLKLCEVAVRTSATFRRVHPGGASDDLHAFVTEAVRGIADALAHEEKKDA